MDCKVHKHSILNCNYYHPSKHLLALLGFYTLWSDLSIVRDGNSRKNIANSFRIFGFSVIGKLIFARVPLSQRYRLCFHWLYLDSGMRNMKSKIRICSILSCNHHRRRISLQYFCHSNTWNLISCSFPKSSSWRDTTSWHRNDWHYLSQHRAHFPRILSSVQQRLPSLKTYKRRTWSKIQTCSNLSYNHRLNYIYLLSSFHSCTKS